MSLRIWLPLNGSLKNQGIDKVTVTNNGATINDNGKIGKCYSFDGNDDYISLTGSCLYNTIKGGTQPFSIAFWVYHADSTRAILFGDYSLSGSIGFNVELRTDHVVRFYWNGSPDLNITQMNVGNATWTHVSLVYDTTHLYGYINGSLVYTYTNALTAKNKTSGSYYLGRDSRTGTTALNGKLNDFRLYDHALSQQEIKKLAQGLILHYPLETGNLINYNTITHGYYLNSTGNEQGDNGWCHTDYIRIMPNSSYVGIGLSAGGSNTYAVLYDGSKTKTRTVLLVANQNLSITTTENEYYIRLSIRKYVNELTTTAKFLQINTIKDISGYQNNGELIGTFSYTTDTPKYHVSTYAQGSGSTYLKGIVLPSEAKTVSLWIKGAKNVNSAIFNDKTTGLQIGLLNSLLYTNSISSTAGFTTTHWKNNEWNHVVVINNNGSRLCYVNGEAETQSGSSNYYIHNVNEFWVWNRSYNNNYSFTGNLSDLRIYVTALSADEVKDLYKDNITD